MIDFIIWKSAENFQYYLVAATLSMVLWAMAVIKLAEWRQTLATTLAGTLVVFVILITLVVLRIALGQPGSLFSPLVAVFGISTILTYALAETVARRTVA